MNIYESSPDYYSIAARVESLDQTFALLRDEHGGEFRWPVSKLPPEVKVGDTVLLKIMTKKTEEDEKYTRMRKLLEELIN